MPSDWGQLAGNSEMDRIFVFMKSNGPIALSTVGLNTFKWLYIYVPPTEGGGHIVFGAVPVGVGVGVGVRVGVRVRVASFLRDIF